MKNSQQGNFKFIQIATVYFIHYTILQYYLFTILAYRVECLPMVRETGVQSPGRVIPKTQKMLLDATLLSTQDYKVRIKGKVGAIQGME